MAIRELQTLQALVFHILLNMVYIMVTQIHSKLLENE